MSARYLARAHPSPPPAPQAPPHDHEHFATREWAVPSGVACSQLEEQLRRPGLLRAKGWVETREGPMLVQVVGRRIELTPDSPPRPELLGRVVLREPLREAVSVDDCQSAGSASALPECPPNWTPS